MDKKIKFLFFYNLVWFGLVWFYGISTIVGYLMPNPFYTHIKYIIIGSACGVMDTA